MRVLLDGNLPRTFAALLPGHRVDTIHQRRWSDLDDGPLLDAAEKEYGAFVTADQNVQCRQNLSGRRIRIVLPLRADLHRLFDKGYITVTPEDRLEVSKRLKADYSTAAPTTLWMVRSYAYR